METAIPRISTHANSTRPCDVRTAREVVLQCLSNSDITEATRVINSYEEFIDVPELHEPLFEESEVKNLVTTLDRVLTTRRSEQTYEVQLRSVLEKIIQRLKDSGRITDEALKAIKVLRKTNRNVPARRTREDTVNSVTYETGVEGIGLDDGDNECGDRRTRTLLFIEVKNHYEDYPKLPGSNAASNKQCIIDIVYQTIMYAMRTQRSILRDVQSNELKFVLVSLVMFKDVAVLVKLTSAEWWSYSYELKVSKYNLASARDVVNVLQLYVLRLLVVNVDTNEWLAGQFQQDLSQLYVPAHEFAYPSYPAQVQLLQNVKLNHIRKCLLQDCVKTLIQHSTLYWPNLLEEAEFQKGELYDQLVTESNAETKATLMSQLDTLKMRIAELRTPTSVEPSSNGFEQDWYSRLQNDIGNTVVVTKVVSALNYSGCSCEIFTDHYYKFLRAVKNKVSKAPVAAKYTKLLDLHVCICSRKENTKSSVVVTMYSGDCICAHNEFLADWKKQPSLAKAAFTEQVCNVCIGMLEDGLRYYHSDLRPPNITVDRQQNRFVLTVIDWDNVRECDNLVHSREMDNFYPDLCASHSATMASAAYTAYQLLLTVYIVHRAANSGGNKLHTANAVELYMRICDPIYQKGGASGDTASGDATVGKSCSKDAITEGAERKLSKYGKAILANAARERSNFLAWTSQMGSRFDNLIKWLIDPRECTFDLLRAYLLVAVNTDVTSDTESRESVVPMMSGESQSTPKTTAAVPANKEDKANVQLKFKRPAPVPMNLVPPRRSERLQKKSKPS